MGKRRDGREAAIQFLYQLDANDTPLGQALSAFWTLRAGPDGKSETPVKTRTFAEDLIRGVTDHKPAIDEKIKSFARNFELHRIAGVDRNILRLGIYELLHSADVPPVVIINECIEIAKRFGGEESGRFVNGILDSLRKELPRAPRGPAKPRARTAPHKAAPVTGKLKQEGGKA
jgi:N utilization substance protein B